MFQVTPEETDILRSQFATSNQNPEKRGGRQQFKDVYNAIRALMTPPTPRKRPIGFTADISGEVA